MLRRIAEFIPKLWGNWLSLLGTTLATVAGNAFLILTVVDIVTAGKNQYAATFAYLLMPPLFVIGLVAIAIGIWRDHRRQAPTTTIDKAMRMVMDDRVARRRAFFVGIATFINVTLVSVAAFRGVTYMESSGFCGKLCHSVMKPEYNAYILSPHARVPCVDCHIGEGTSWFVRSKLSGLRQVWAAMTGRFSRPVPTPIHHLRPARETCEHCHWPEKFHGDRTLVRYSYKSDEANTQLASVVRLNVGGVNRRSGRFEGIHWHVGRQVKVEYEALDNKRATIGKITLNDHGKITVYESTTAAKGAKVHERRLMDCVDCHNRPTHIYDASPETALDRAFALGKIDTRLPFIRREALLQLRRTTTRPDDAAATFTAGLEAFYKRSYPEVARTKAAAITKAGRELGWIYGRNIYPELKITWGTYPSHIGHRQTTEGCFRCHDDQHKSSSGKVVRQDCDLCHEVMAEESEKPEVPESILRLGKM